MTHPLPLTGRARKVMQLATEGAYRLNHEYIGTEHVLLGLFEEGSSVTPSMFEAVNYDIENARTLVCDCVQSGPSMKMRGNLSQTPRVRNVLQYADEEARHWEHEFVAPAHILIGLFRESDGVAAALLTKLRIEFERVLMEIEDFPDEP
jgi:ATP-dependent Clp protease ATP-binding subunit ClpC